MDEKLKEVVADVEHSATECCADMRQKAADMGRCVEDFARQEPLKALLIAGGVGLLVGIMVSRR
jgi:ElaB/YqjD/DUF883 family membrane-anchored ribosome-binding protein